nr:MAG TPA: hypothetical protein [Caudoviricetes sp.]
MKGIQTPNSFLNKKAITVNHFKASVVLIV